MPNCIIKDCKYYSGRKLNEFDDVRLHVFPKNLETIKKWLQSIQKSGQDFGDINEFAQRVYDGKDLFRICSQHFDEDCYTFQIVRKKFMKKEAIPTIFKKEVKGKKPKPPATEPPVKKVHRDTSPIKELDPGEIESGVYPLFMYQSVIAEPHSARLHRAPTTGEYHESTTEKSGLYADGSSPFMSHLNVTMPKIVNCVSLQSSIKPDILPMVATEDLVPPTPMVHIFLCFTDVGVNTNYSFKKDASTETPEFKDPSNAIYRDSTSAKKDKSVQVPET